jgi:hypothetical protein
MVTSRQSARLERPRPVSSVRRGGAQTWLRTGRDMKPSQRRAYGRRTSRPRADRAAFSAVDQQRERRVRQGSVLPRSGAQSVTGDPLSVKIRAVSSA